MQLRTCSLGPDAPHVTRIGFGCMPLSTEGRPADERESIRVIHGVLDAGVTLLDTSNAYCLNDDDIGHNERLVAKALRTWTGNCHNLVVATKGGRTRPQGRWEVDGRPEQLKRACELSLQALGVEQIDLYQMNIPDPKVPFLDSVGALSELQKEGKIRWIGLSNVSVRETISARSMIEVVTVQNRFNPIFRNAIEEGVIKYCTDHGIGFMPFHPLGGWWLSKQLVKHEVLQRIAREKEVSPYAVVLAWEIAQGPTVIPIPASKSLNHALDSISAANLILDEADLSAIDQAVFSRGDELRHRLRLYLSRFVGRVAVPHD